MSTYQKFPSSVTAPTHYTNSPSSVFVPLTNYTNLPAVGAPPGTASAWLDGQDINLSGNAGINDTDPIGTWKNKGSRGSALDVLQAVGANKPLFAKVASAGKINNLSAVRFNGTSTFMRSATISDAAQPNIFAIVAMSTVVNDATNRVVVDGAVNAKFHEIYKSTTGLISMYGGNALSSAVNWQANKYSQLNATFNGASSILHADKTSIASGNAGTNVISGITVGSDAVSAEFWSGDIVEVLLYLSADAALPTLASIEAYFDAKYGSSWPQ